MTETLDWREFALCRGMDPELFFPVAEPGSPRYARDVAPAKAVCAQCPVREACLAMALATEDPARRFGVFGGLDPAERAALRRAAAAA